MAQKRIPGKPLAALGLMSGTSMDGIDVAMLRTDGVSLVERGPAACFAYDARFRQDLAAALDTARAIGHRDERPGDLAGIERELTLRHAAAVDDFLRDHRLKPSDVDVIGFHGQTVLHRPQQALTVQLGDGALLAETTGIPVVFDLRARDMELGGQGAPLVPAYHRALAENLPEEMRGRRPVAFVNIGGISNITWIGSDGALIAFDAGPGNALIDQWVAAHAGIPYDAGGAIASEGTVLVPLAERYLASAFFRKAAPKSLDRNDFRPPDPQEASLEDGARTLAFVTARAIWKSVEHLPEPPGLWVICGGGRHNRAIMDDLIGLAAAGSPRRGRTVRVVAAEEAGFDGDSMEAEAWAYLAVRALFGLEITWPGTTGVRQPATGGVLAMPPGRRKLALG